MSVLSQSASDSGPGLTMYWLEQYCLWSLEPISGSQRYGIEKNFISSGCSFSTGGLPSPWVKLLKEFPNPRAILGERPAGSALLQSLDLSSICFTHWMSRLAHSENVFPLPLVQQGHQSHTSEFQLCLLHTHRFFPPPTVFFQPTHLPLSAFLLNWRLAAPHSTLMMRYTSPRCCPLPENICLVKDSNIPDQGNEPVFKATAVVTDLLAQTIFPWWTGSPVSWEHGQTLYFLSLFLFLVFDLSSLCVYFVKHPHSCSD